MPRSARLTRDAPAWVHRGLRLGIGGLGVLSVAGFAGQLHWLVELTSHFRLQYAIAGAVGALAAAVVRQRGWALGAAALAAINAGELVPLYLPPERPPAGTALRVLAFNVNVDNGRLDDVAGHIASERADLTFVIEVSAAMHERLAALPPPFELIASEPRRDNFGIALVASRPGVEARLVRLAAGIDFVVAELDHDGRRWTVLGAHPLPPVGARYAARRNAAFDAIADWAQRQPGPHAVVGDLNATPFSPRFEALLHDGGLASSQPGYGYGASWPKGVAWLWPAQIPIDHALVGGGARVRARRLGPSLGSDHAPLLVELAAP